LLSVLDLFDIEQPDWSVEQAAKALTLATSTTYRYFAALTARGMLTTLRGGRYVLGPKIIQYDRLLRLTDPLIFAAQTELDCIAQIRPGQTVVFLCRLLAKDVMCVAEASAGAPTFAVGYERGRPMPLYRGSASKVILAMLPSRQLKSLYRRDKESFHEAGFGDSWEQVLATLRGIRSQRFFISTGEIDQGMRGISVPISVAGTSIVASLNVAGPASGLTPPIVSELLNALQGARSRITEALLTGVTPT
jgi:DNA-binding IclR family transcriptional regulator